MAFMDPDTERMRPYSALIFLFYFLVHCFIKFQKSNPWRGAGAWTCWPGPVWRSGSGTGSGSSLDEKEKFMNAFRSNMDKDIL